MEALAPGPLLILSLGLLRQFTEEEVEAQPGWAVGGTEGGLQPRAGLDAVRGGGQGPSSLFLKMTLPLHSPHLVCFTVTLWYLSK